GGDARVFSPGQGGAGGRPAAGRCGPASEARHGGAGSSPGVAVRAARGDRYYPMAGRACPEPGTASCRAASLTQVHGRDELFRPECVEAAPMSGGPLRLVDLAASVADGTADIDWDAVGASLHDDEERQLLRDLNVLAGISDVHRSIATAPRATRKLGSTKVVGRISPASGDLPTIEERVLPQRPRGATEFWGHLALLEQIGEGSFGFVYRAQDTRLDRDVALKLLRPGRAAAELAGKI